MDRSKGLFFLTLLQGLSWADMMIGYLLKVWRICYLLDPLPEFLHHLETNAGLFSQGSLVEEDDRRMMEYYKNHTDH